MIRQAIRGVLCRPAQSLILGIGLVLTLVGLAGLTTGAHSTTVSLKGDLTTAWDTPFDILVRPAGSVEPLEQRSGLVRPNYVSGLDGGITVAQLAEIRSVPGVSLAAPLAAVGAVNWPSAFQLRIPHPSRRTSVFRVTSSTEGQAGLSTYPIPTRYLVIAPRGRLSFDTGQMSVPGYAGPISCGYPVNCFAGTVCFGGHCSRGQFPASADAAFYLPLLQPVQVAGIDPVAEARLTGLGKCVRTGRLLNGQDRPAPASDPEPAEMLPVMASNDAFLHQVLRVTVARGAWGADRDPTSIRRWAPTVHRHASLQSLYRSYLDTSVHDYLDPWPIWSAGDVQYRTVGPDHLAADPVARDLGIYQRVNTFQEVGIDDTVLIPPEASDPWLRPVTEHADTEPPGIGSSYRSKIWDVVGSYDPSCLPGFDPLNGASLEAYAAPDVRTSDGREITPSRALSDYVASPPLLLTTLSGARWLADPSRYRGQPGKAFISVIRVRVSGTDQPGDEAQSRLTAVSAAIHERTDLQVDIVKGASTRPISVDLPAGRFGRPALTVQEQWSVKGVTLVFLRAVDNQDRTLLLLLLVSAGLLVAQASYMAVSQRRRQLATLRALDWSPFQLATLVELETSAIGLSAGLVAMLTSIPVLLRVHEPVAVAASGPPLGILIAGLAALPAAWSASRGSVVSALQRPQPVRRSRAPASTAAVAARELRRSWPVETALAASAVALGAILVGLVVLVAAGFRAQLGTTVLGTALDTQVRSFHVVLAGLSLVLGAGAAAQVMLLAWLSRRHELGVLSALGWSGVRLAWLVCCQACLVGLLGTAGATPVILGCAALMDAPDRSMAIGLAATFGSCVAATVFAALVPCLLALRRPARRLLET